MLLPYTGPFLPKSTLTNHIRPSLLAHFDGLTVRAVYIFVALVGPTRAFGWLKSIAARQ